MPCKTPEGVSWPSHTTHQNGAPATFPRPLQSHFEIVAQLAVSRVLMHHCAALCFSPFFWQLYSFRQTQDSLEKCCCQSAWLFRQTLLCSLHHACNQDGNHMSTSTAPVSSGTRCMSHSAVRHCWYASACEST